MPSFPNCPSWVDNGTPGGGKCLAGRYGGQPSLGCCRVCLAEGNATKPPEPAPSGFLARAASYIKAEASMAIAGPLNDAAYNQRIDTCNACTSLQREPAPLVGWCSSCGCGTGARAELTIKGRMPAATCPLGKWPA